MTGTIVNVAGIILGSLIGLLFKKGIPEHIRGAILKMEGLAIAVIALNGVLNALNAIDENIGGLLLTFSLVLGCLFGEILKIDDRFNKFALFVESKIKTTGFAKGFVTASLIFPIGAMSVIGPINDALLGDTSILMVKTLLDGTTSIVLASILGYGVMFACIPVFLIQSAFALMAKSLSPFISDSLLSMFCMVGYAIVMTLGINFLFDCKIKVANLLPSLIVPIAYYFIIYI